MSPRSSTLFHFTKSRDILQKILKEGFWPRYCQEDVSWLGFEDFDYISYPMVCFCDIPLSRIAEHVNFYGSFGIGMSRTWAEKNGLNPILYLAGENRVSAEFLKLNTHVAGINEKGKAEAMITMRYLYAHLKPVTGTMVVNGVPVEKHFYHESEWRHVPQHKTVKEFLLRKQHDDVDQLKVENEKTKDKCLLKFVPGDVRYIFVKSDADIPSMINFIQTELDGYSGADLKILMSRVLSLESVHADL